MDKGQKKAALQAYRERKVEAGVYAVRCQATGQNWVGGAPDLSTIQNRLWFSLRMGGDPHRSLQDAWKAHGGERFTFEILERFDDEAPGYDRGLMLKQRSTHWCAALQAESLGQT